MIKDADFGKCFYSRYGISFDTRDKFSLCHISGFGKNAIIFGVDNISTHMNNMNNRYKKFLVLGKGPTQELLHILQYYIDCRGVHVLSILVNRKINFA